MKSKWYWLFIVISVLLSDVMCAIVGYKWATMECGIKYQGYSAPAYVALIHSIPYIIAIMICIIIAVVLKKGKSNS